MRNKIKGGNVGDASTTIVLFEDMFSDSLRPIGLFSPLYTLRLGTETLEDIVRSVGIPVEVLVRERLLYKDVLENADVSRLGESPLLFLNASVEPDVRYADTIRDYIRAGDPFITTSGNRVAAAYVTPDYDLDAAPDTATIHSRLLELGLPLENETFATLDYPHMAVDAHLRLLETNMAARIERGGLNRISDGVFVADGIQLPAHTDIDASVGPVIFEKDVSVGPFTFFEGPVYIGECSRILEHAAVKDRTAVGHGCKIGGEVEASVVDEWSNKQHHGFLGHSWVGKWVNLGAGTTTSDLKNTYGTIRMDYRGERSDTGMQFLGSIIGDYAKTAINTSLFTGKLVGVCSLVYGTVTRNVPSFSNYARSFGQVTEISLDQILTTQRRMFGRRDIKQGDYDIELMRRVFEYTRDERVMGDEQINF